ncbi:SagB family peptide dehydrogenase [Gordonia sp. CPCC 206044]|uniref:SagB family peptide dehydrogenase n=1 Tax=Gordonia sp. CPCC 206044 TaxID=3140793 RepID=UPI003AF384B7
MSTSQTSYALSPGARCLIGGGGVAVLLPAKQRLDGLSPAQVDVLRRLNAGPVSFVETIDSETQALLHTLVDAGVVSITVSLDGRDLYTLRPFRRPPAARPDPDTGPVEISRFTIVRKHGDDVVAEHPRSWSDIVVHDPAVLGVVTGLGAAHVDALPTWVVERLHADLYWTGHAISPGAERSDFATRSWSPHELWFHRRTTVGDRAAAFADFGPTRWADGEFEPLPARRDTVAGEVIALPAPDLDELQRDDLPLVTVVEARTSVRDFDDADPMSIAQLGELLYRCGRTRSVRTVDANRAVPEELPSRPYPSGGSLYELEIYPVIRNVEGVAPGMYHYDSYDHALRLVAPYDDPAVQRLIAPASLTLADGQRPQVMLAIAARVGRIMWTYEQMPYAVILKHVGVLTQTLYLTATAMGLGGVAQGYGDTAAFAEATGADELVEANVGTFVVGTPRE